MAADLISVCVSALSVCSSADSDCTVTVSVSCPISSRASTRLTVFTDTGTAVLTDSLNPCSDTFTSYVPASTLVKL